MRWVLCCFLAASLTEASRGIGGHGAEIDHVVRRKVPIVKKVPALAPARAPAPASKGKVPVKPATSPARTTTSTSVHVATSSTVVVKTSSVVTQTPPVVHTTSTSTSASTPITGTAMIYSPYTPPAGQSFGQYAGQIAEIRGVMMGAQRESWEQGVTQDALLEIDYPSLSVFGNSPFQSSGLLPQSVLQMALSSVVHGMANGRLAVGAADTSSILDTCSPGMGVLLGQYTQGNNAPVNWGSHSDALLNYMMTQAPRTATGALSHRSDVIQYWADGVYMATGFLSAYGLVHNRPDVLNFAYTNIKLYRQALFVPQYNLWGHIRNNVAANAAITQGWQDQGIWATGNAWVLGGLVRLLAAMQKAPNSQQYASEMNDLMTWAQQIVDGMLAARTSNGFVRNYINQGGSFGDASSSAFLSWGIYRLANMVPATYKNEHYLGAADSLRQAVMNNLSALGTLISAVDVLGWNGPGILSTEGQAFALMMMAAYRDLNA